MKKKLLKIKVGKKIDKEYPLSLNQNIFFLDLF